MKRYAVWVEVDLGKLRENVAAIRAFTGEKRKIMAVVKANAYGHGLQAIAKMLSSSVDYLAVANVTEAREIRRLGITTPILVMGMCILDNDLAIQNNITLSISSVEIADLIDKTALRLGRQAKVHIKVDTGMGRMGLSYRSAYENIQKILQLTNISVEGIYTHFSTADNPNSSFASRQMDLFELLLAELEKKGIRFPLIHACNSAGIVSQLYGQYTNMIRPGLLLYGYGPHKRLPENLKLRPVLSLKAKVLFIKEIEMGKAVSYGRSFEARQRARIGIIPIGYSHGFPYSLSQKASFLFKGKKYPIAGNICMDYTMISLGFEGNIKIGDEFILIGESESEQLDAYTLAKEAGTIPYEILTGLHERLPRVYVGE